MVASDENEKKTKHLKIFIHAMDGPGHLNACVGLAQVLLARGHQVYFLINAGFGGQLAQYGFSEILLKKSPPPQFGSPVNGAIPKVPSGPPMNPVKFGAQMILRSGILGPKSPLQKLKDNGDKSHEFLMQTLLGSSIDYNPQIEQAMDREKPDLFILDHFLVPPALLKQTEVPWICLWSGNPLGLYGSDKLPPCSSGFPTKSDPTSWEEFRELRRKQMNVTKFQRKLCDHFGISDYQNPFSQKRSIFPQSPSLNIYGYPEELDYDRDVVDPIGTEGSNYTRVDAFCREEEEKFELPEMFQRSGEEKLVYFSLGSMGSVDVDLMKRICEALAHAPYKCIVSKGPLGDEYELPPNCWGRNYLPQTRILPLVDLVITHGGNNTITESFAAGKPMIVLPLFGDQYDNAQRIHELGYGVRLEPYQFQEQQLLDSMDQLLNNSELRGRLKAAAKRIELDQSKQKVCEQIEQLVQQSR